MRRFTLGQPIPDPSDHPIFDGRVHMREHVGEQEGALYHVSEVAFQAGGRTRWHSHDRDQLLFVIAGDGIIASEDERFEVGPGEVVLVPAGTLHWHGPQPGRRFTQISVITDGLDAIGPPVTGES